MLPDVALIAPSSSAGHLVPAGHPESVARIEAVMRALGDPAFAALPRLPSRPASDDDLSLVHEPAHITRLEQAADRARGGRIVAIDPDTMISEGSLAAARDAVGAGIAAVDWVLAGPAGAARRAFCAVRPPGHHAEPDAAMGFCLFNSAAIAVRHALTRHGLGRVVLVDFDVHHGNGSQTLAMADPDFFYASIHQSPAYPGTGEAGEVASGNLFNAPLAPGAGPAAWRAAFGRLLETVAAWKPDLIVISAGFDAHARDPLADINLSESDFMWATEQVCGLGTGRVVSMLEGGYHLQALEASVRAHVTALLAPGG
jgi:acetoin utilization deacetylase AcuC-like enzyme